MTFMMCDDMYDRRERTRRGLCAHWWTEVAGRCRTRGARRLQCRARASRQAARASSAHLDTYSLVPMMW